MFFLWGNAKRRVQLHGFCVVYVFILVAREESAPALDCMQITKNNNNRLCVRMDKQMELARRRHVAALPI